jgi:hypothetical protein
MGAYDNVWRNAAWAKMVDAHETKSGDPREAVLDAKRIKALYNNMGAQKVGIHGGFTSDLPEEIRGCGAGVNLGDVEIACLGFLDDYMTPSRSEEVIGRVLETMRGYSVRWDVHWAISKFRVLCFNTAPATSGWAYEGTPVQTTDQHKYLGVIHSTKKPYWHAHHTEKLAVACFLIVKLRAAGLMGGRNAPGAALEVVRSMVWQVPSHRPNVYQRALSDQKKK